MNSPSADPRTAATPPVRRGRPRKTVQEREESERRAELLQAAARLFRSQGYDATSTRDIATAAGMQSGSPFYYFESKSAMLHAVMQAGMAEVSASQAQLLRQLGARAPALERLRALIRHHLGVVVGPDSHFIPVMLYEWRSLSDAQRGEITRLKDLYESVWTPVLRALHASGEMAGDPRVVRLMLFGAVNWSAQWYDPARVGQGGSSLDELADITLQLFLKDPP